MEYALGIDLGGTNTKLGLVHKSGRIAAQAMFPTSESPKPPEFARRVAKELGGLLEQGRVQFADIAGAGIGLPGLVDNIHGIVHVLTNVKGWDGMPVGAMMEKCLRLPTCVENDVNAMALGEYHSGAARGYANVVCITLGTGVGGGIIIDGKLYHGATLSAGEIGHMMVVPNGSLCGCGKRGCLEALIGTKGLLTMAKQCMKKNKKGLLARWVGEGTKLTPHLLDKAAARKDRNALAVWETAAMYLGMVFGGLANFLNPDIFVVGGGICAVGNYFYDEVRKVAKDYAMSVPAKKLKIVRSGLGNRAGVIGAASLVFDRYGLTRET